MYVLSTGCQWRAIPKDLPPKSTVYDYFDLWTRAFPGTGFAKGNEGVNYLASNFSKPNSTKQTK
jgi:hypothetical protein